MMDENIARLRTHRNNIARYRRLLQTRRDPGEHERVISAPSRDTARTRQELIRTPSMRTVQAPHCP